MNGLCHQNSDWFLQSQDLRLRKPPTTPSRLLFFSPRGPVKGSKGEETRGNVRVAVFSKGRTERIGRTRACTTLVICTIRRSFSASGSERRVRYLDTIIYRNIDTASQILEPFLPVPSNSWAACIEIFRIPRFAVDIHVSTFEIHGQRGYFHPFPDRHSPLSSSTIHNGHPTGKAPPRANFHGLQ